MFYVKINSFGKIICTDINYSGFLESPVRPIQFGSGKGSINDLDPRP